MDSKKKKLTKGIVVVHTSCSKPRAYNIQYFVPIQYSGMTRTKFLILVVCSSLFFLLLERRIDLGVYRAFGDHGKM
jgi:hypothetical protein